MKTRVLVVDDDDDLREALCEALLDEGFEPVGAGDGVQALAELRDRRADIILLDLMMPVMNGWDFRAQQNRDPALATIPVVVMTAAANVNRKDELAADAYLQKPLALRSLFELLRALQPQQ